jgi:hypothetical protein
MHKLRFWRDFTHGSLIVNPEGQWANSSSRFIRENEENKPFPDMHSFVCLSYSLL